jgi:aspartate/glutamate racemase
VDTITPAPTLAQSGIYHARRGQVAYGFSIGVLMLECNIPFVPGDVGNASTYDFPVQFLLVPGATGDAVINKQDPAITPNFVEAAKRLEAQGVRAITGDCAYMGAYQEAVADAVDVPVFLSSLMQVPLVLSMLRKSQKLAVLVANGQTVSDRLLRTVGIGEEIAARCVFRGLEDREHFRSVILEESGEIDVDRMEAEMVATATELVEADPSIGAFLLECSDMPPYGAAVQRATGRPVFDWIGFINYVHHAVVRTPYRGHF